MCFPNLTDLEMASGQERAQLEDVLTSFHSAVLEDYGFRVTYDNDGKKVVDKSANVCEHCATRAAYASSTTYNMMIHLCRHNPTVSVDSTRRNETGRKE